MRREPFETWLLGQETRALLTRLDRLKPLVLQETMVPAAGISRAALLAIESFLVVGQGKLRAQIREYLDWLDGDLGRRATSEEAQHRFTFLKLRFNAVLTQMDIFSEVMSQRSEAETGVWLAGLDVAAADALALPGVYLAPPVVCYLARDPGGAIRRARARLPGGGENPVAVIRLPRERMIGSGIASSLVHEVGHQAAELLQLLPSLRRSLAHRPAHSPLQRFVWGMWGRWLSEVVADLWAVARVGVASTTGLMSLVSLPRVFVFRPNVDDPHPTPWIRVKLSCAFGDALYPHRQWGRLAAAWESFYPPSRLSPSRLRLLRATEASIPAVVAWLLGHRPPALGRKSLAEVLTNLDRTPAELGRFADGSPLRAASLAGLSPTLAFAAIGQARVDGRITPEIEGRVLGALLRNWAVKFTMKDLRRTPATMVNRRAPTLSSMAWSVASA